MRRALLVLAVALALVAPAAATTGTGLYGKVSRGPSTPVCSAEQPCSAPAAGVMLKFVRNGTVVAHAVTASDGSYRVALGAGVYSVMATARIGRGLRPATVVVAGGHWTLRNFSIDTGIR